MTLPEKLAAEALPCRELWQGCTIPGLGHPGMCPASNRHAVEAAIRKAIRECEYIADAGGDACCHSCEQIRKEIALLLTEETR